MLLLYVANRISIEWHKVIFIENDEWLKVSRVSKIQEEIARLQERLEEERSKEAERLGSIAVKAGLADLEISDRDLLKALKEVAARFQSSGTE